MMRVAIRSPASPARKRPLNGEHRRVRWSGCNEASSGGGCIALRLSCVTVRFEDGEDFVGSMDFASLGLGEALFEVFGDGLLVHEQPFFFGFQEIEGSTDDLRRLGKVAEVDFTLDALFGGGIEGEIHGESIARPEERRFASRMPTSQKRDMGLPRRVV